MPTIERNLPAPAQAEALLREAEGRNPGPWADHSRNAALAARLIAERCRGMDAQSAYTLGLLHDIGRYYGVTSMRHVLDGYRHMQERGFPWAARICLTHSFDCKDIESANGEWDCTPEEYAFINQYLQTAVYDDYDRLIQLCDALATGQGFCLMEKRYVDVAIRRGVTEKTPLKWKAALENLQYFERMTGTPIYRLLPGVAEGTFGFAL